LGARTLQRNPFWRNLVDHPGEVPEHVYYGLCIENYHLLFRESYFDAPVLSYPWSRDARRLINHFYLEEFGHDELLLRSLESIGLSREALFRSVPLPGTMALCNALATWARHDPLFFLTTLGPLEGREVEIDSFVAASRAKGLPESFVGPIAKHAGINKEAGHGLLTREIFAMIPTVAALDAARVFRLTHLFIAIYDRFYADIWRHYAGGGPLLRAVPS
jgi:hypothetical protein